MILKNSVKIIIAFIVVFIVGCSTKKDTFINRNFHSINTKYNVLYNGNQSFENGLKQLNANYEDNYWAILPIEPLKVDELARPGAKGTTDSSPQEFEKSEEKAVKAVQKHSMLISRVERNNQIDEAYLLLGKSRYYSKRFVPALEAFNYALYNYPKASLINDTKIWQAKTHVRLRNEGQAIENLKLLLKNKKLSSEIYEKSYTALAMAYTASDSIPQVISNLKLAIKTNYSKEQTARNLYILGQLYSANKIIDTSNYYFQQVIDFKKAPYKYKIHAKIEKAKNSTSKEDSSTALATLEKLTKNIFNEPYLDKLYYQMGVMEEKIDKEKALENYKKSIASSIGAGIQKELSYEAVGNVFFDKAEFVTAAAYYDSILQITKEDTSKRIFRLKRKRNNLNEVILHEGIVKTNDSVLAVVAMSATERETYFKEHIEKLKAQEEKQNKKINAGSGIASISKPTEKNSGKWYFYNPQTVGFGAQEFKRIWGNRPLEDGWRLSDKTVINLPGATNNDSTESVTGTESALLTLNYYLDKIPTDKQKISILKRDRDDSYYNLGLIYKEQFKEKALAKDKLEKLLTLNPAINYELPAKYHLYQLYMDENNPLAAILKVDILSNYPASNYAKIIENPSKALEEGAINLAEEDYACIFYEFKDEKFDDVIINTNSAILKYQGDPIIAKFELLKAYAIGKKEGLVAFKEALDFVTMNYPNTEESRKALEIIATIKSKI